MRSPRFAESTALLYGFVLLAVAGPLRAAEFSGEASAQGRWFPEDPLRDEQHGSIVSAAVEPEFWHDWADGDHRFYVQLFGRWDSGDDERTHADIRELYWRGTFRQELDVFVGFRKVFWGVTETVHLVDIINQTDFVENIRAEDKLGQPMVSATWFKDWGTVDLFLLPFFRERTFPGAKGRPGLPLRIDTGNPVYESSAEDTHFDWSARYSHYIGDIDFGLAWFSGTDRLPNFVPNADGTALLPLYEIVHRASLDAQWTREAWLWKLESVVRDRADKVSFGAVGGFEYTFFGVFDSAADIGVLAEYQYDDRVEPIIADNDIALGGRLTLNDVQDTQLLAFAAFDVDTGGMFTSVEGARRVGLNWGVSLEGRFFVNTDPEDLLHAFRRDHYVELEVTRYF
jgi:hypothetical protein